MSWGSEWRQKLARVVNVYFTPLTYSHYLELLNPLWSFGQWPRSSRSTAWSSATPDNSASFWRQYGTTMLRIWRMALS